MYEEEDDDLPRSYRLLGSHMQTSAEFNSRVENYLYNRVAMARLLDRTDEEWRANEVNMLFAKSFPNAGQQAQQLSQSLPMYTVQPQSPVERPVFQSVSYIPRSRRRSQAPSQSIASPTSDAPPDIPTPATVPHTPASRATPSLDSSMGPDTPLLDYGFSNGSAFTTELPPEAKMLLGNVSMPMEDPCSPTTFSPRWPASTTYFGVGDISNPPVKVGNAHNKSIPDYFGTEFPTQFKYDPSTAGLDESWNAYINENPWKNEQSSVQ